MKTINAKIFSLKYALLKKLNTSLENDKKALKEGAKITFNNYCKIKIIECSRKSYTKEQQEMLDKYAQEKGFEKQETTYTRIDIDNIPTEIDNKVDELLNNLENDNDRIITKVASAVKNIK